MTATPTVSDEQILAAWREHSVWAFQLPEERIARAREVLALSSPPSVGEPACVCGEPSSPNVKHRTDGPCFVDGSAKAWEPLTASTSQALSSVLKSAVEMGWIGYAETLEIKAALATDSAKPATPGELAVRYLKGFADGRRVEKEALAAAPDSQGAPKPPTQAEIDAALDQIAEVFAEPSDGAQAAGQRHNCDENRPRPWAPCEICKSPAAGQEDAS